jgi:aspartate/methionine/tyrosine aminotransferase
MEDKMKIDDFVLENWLNPACDSEKNKVYLGGSCVLPLTVEELFELTGESMEDFLEELKTMNLGYGNFEGTPRTRKAIANLYRNVDPEDVILVHGGTGANNTVVLTLIEETDNVISIMPNYQQFYSIPKSLGAEVRQVHLKPEAGYKLDLDELRNAVDNNTKAILFTNPNNPTGSLLELEEMMEIVETAKAHDARVVCDEMYRGLKEEYMPSFADIYDKAIVTCSSSKIYSMAGTRVGWIICKDPETKKNFSTAGPTTPSAGVYSMNGFLQLPLSMRIKFLQGAGKSSMKTRQRLINGWKVINTSASMRMHTGLLI